MQPFAQGVLIGVLLGAVSLILLIVLQPQRRCPKCRVRLPKMLRPGGLRQALMGGWSCPSCGAQVDRHGRLMEQRGTRAQ